VPRTFGRAQLWVSLLKTKWLEGWVAGLASMRIADTETGYSQVYGPG
jgi:hypothetical protein